LQRSQFMDAMAGSQVFLSTAQAYDFLSSRTAVGA